MTDKQEAELNVDEIAPGMIVEASQGDLGEADVSKPKVSEIIRDQQGNVEKVVVKKGAIFQKELDVPVSRIQHVEHSATNPVHGTITIATDEAELEGLHALGAEQLAEGQSILDQVEQSIPTAEGIRNLETVSAHSNAEAATSEQEQKTVKPAGLSTIFRLLGPGFLGGMAGNDSSAVTAYSIDGAQNGFGHLWLLLLATPMYHSVMFTCAKIGRVTGQGLAEVLREHYGRWMVLLAALILIVANIALITADLVAIGTGLELLSGIGWVWFVVPVGILLWYLTVFRNFESIKKIFIVMSLAFLVYFVTAILAHPDWRGVLLNTFVPHLDLNFASISSAVALLGATISPYNIFWQVQGEKEEIRTGPLKKKLHAAALDVMSGVFSGNLIAYVIIISTASTLFIQHKNITTAADAALALTSVLGPAAKYLFAVGFIGAGLVAIPVLMASTSYAVAGSMGWPAGLSKRPWQNEGFYLILSGSMLISLILALVHLDPIKLMFWANILSGVLSPVLVIYLLFLANNQKIMCGKTVGRFTNIGLVVTFVVMATAAVLLFYGLATGQGS